MSFEEIMQTISNYWAVFVASGAYAIIATYGVVIIRQLFVRATTSQIVTKFINTISVGINKTLGFVGTILSRLNFAITYITGTYAKIQRLEQQIAEFKNEFEAFTQAILNASGQEDILTAYNANLSPLNSPTTDELVFIEEETEEEVTPIVEPKQEPKPKKAKNKKAVIKDEEIY